jgi:hypothetical protein
MPRFFWLEVSLLLLPADSIRKIVLSQHAGRKWRQMVASKVVATRLRSHVGASINTVLGELREGDFESLLDSFQDFLVLIGAHE